MTRELDARSTADDVLAAVDLAGKRFLVTGVSSGIGLEAPLPLHLRTRCSRSDFADFHHHAA